jgi:hypothetical protein
VYVVTTATTGVGLSSSDFVVFGYFLADLTGNTVRKKILYEPQKARIFVWKVLP